jgi:hypothetical protein
MASPAFLTLDGEGTRVFVKVDDGAARLAAEAQDRALSRGWG